MDVETRKVSGREKAAILLLFLGEDVAPDILRNLNEEEIHIVSKQMSQLNNIQPGVIDNVMEEFSERMSSDVMLSLGGEDYVRKVLLKALGDDKAKSIIQLLAMPMIDGRSTSSDVSIAESLRRLDAEAIANLIRDEHPQTIALIMAHLNPEHVSKVIPLLKEELQAEVITRIASLESVPAGAIDEIEDVLQSQIKRMGTGENRNIGGMGPVAEMMNVIDRATGDSIMAKIEEKDPDLANDIKKLMLVFDDLVNIDSRGIQMILKEVSNEDITLALKAASEEMKEHIFKNMSERAAAMIGEDLEALGPVRLGDVENAQQSILSIARRLEEEGKIFVSGRGGEDIIV